MKRARFSRLFGFVAALLLLAACSSKRVNPATLAPDTLFQQASTAYDARKYDRAIPLLEAFVQQYLGDERAPRAQLMLGRSFMAKRDYVTAASHFQRLIESFPSSPLGLEARFAICESYDRLSPRPQLDQEYTRAALLHCESVASYFPGTPEAERATAMAASLRGKLAEKTYNTGLFYQKRRAYDAAVVYFNDVVAQFPQSPLAPAALRQLMDTYQLMGYVEEATEAKERLLREYPQSQEARGVQA